MKSCFLVRTGLTAWSKLSLSLKEPSPQLVAFFSSDPAAVNNRRLHPDWNQVVQQFKCPSVLMLAHDIDHSNAFGFPLSRGDCPTARKFNYLKHGLIRDMLPWKERQPLHVHLIRCGGLSIFCRFFHCYDTTLIVAFWGSFSIVFAVQLMEACGGRLKDILIVAMRLAVAESNWLECVRVLDSTPPSFPSFYRVLWNLWSWRSSIDWILWIQASAGEASGRLS